MKRVILFVLCFVLMAPCAWAGDQKAGDLKAVYTYDEMEVEKDSGKFRIEAKREVNFIYRLTSLETSEDCSIALTNGINSSMDVSGDQYLVYTCTFPDTDELKELGISVDISGTTKTYSADITKGWEIEMDQPNLTIKTGDHEQKIIHFNEMGGNRVTDFDVDDTHCPAVFASFVYTEGSNNWNMAPRITVAAKADSGTQTVPVYFTHKSDSSKSFKRQCTITITNGDSGSGGGGSSGGGCDAGLAGLGLGLLALLPFAARKKR